MKEALIHFYLDYTNNYISIDTFAEAHGVNREEAIQFVQAGKKYHNEQVELTRK